MNDNFRHTRETMTAPAIAAAVQRAIDTDGCEEGPKTIYSEIVAERARQDDIWGGPEHDDAHTIADFVQFIRDRAYNASIRAVRDERVHTRKRLVQIAALAVAAIESMDRKNLRDGEPS